jgi:long-subunit acyl-CoA synthetase (AMP-forming)
MAVDFKKFITDILLREDVVISHFPSNSKFMIKSLYDDASSFYKELKDADSVFLSLKNSYEWLKVYFACVMSGITLFSADFMLSKEELNRRISEANPCVIVDECGVRRFRPAKDKGEFGFIQYTSGTTGNAKGVIMRYKNIASNISAMQERCDFLADDGFLLSSAMSHPMGHIFMLLALKYAKEIIILESPVFLPQAVLGSGASIIVFPPVMLNKFKAVSAIAEQLKKFRYILCAGAPLDDATYAFYKSIGVRIMNGYGMTECVSGIAMGLPNSDSALVPLKGNDIKIAADGEIIVRGSGVCERYLNAPIPSDDGFYHTRDLGYFTPEGMLIVTGRKDNVAVLQNGYKIELETLENKINSVPPVNDCIVRVLSENGKDVIECTVVLSGGIVKPEREIKEEINSKLDFFEKLDRVIVCDTLPTKGSKKLRN